ncbi:unnamed protein product [Enterobius vermicularis]|uniref:PNT domain-containing protein n=1 Tax=Enterobius vermicularis TaxID=51028 RepID=A0A3P6GY62_ENTVE|nr:unnamed protein product [Enterobius vermicularis]
MAGSLQLPAATSSLQSPYNLYLSSPTSDRLEHPSAFSAFAAAAAAAATSTVPSTTSTTLQIPGDTANNIAILIQEHFQRQPAAYFAASFYNQVQAPFSFPQAAVVDALCEQILQLILQYPDMASTIINAVGQTPWGPLVLRRVFNYIHTNNNPCQPKPIPFSESSDLERFRSTSPEFWASDDVTAWLCAVVKAKGIRIEETNAYKFGRCNGKILLSMDEQQFKEMDPNYGHILFAEFRQLIADQRISQRAAMERSSKFL